MHQADLHNVLQQTHELLCDVAEGPSATVRSSRTERYYDIVASRVKLLRFYDCADEVRRLYVALLRVQVLYDVDDIATAAEARRAAQMIEGVIDRQQLSVVRMV